MAVKVKVSHGEFDDLLAGTPVGKGTKFRVIRDIKWGLVDKKSGDSTVSDVPWFFL